MGYSPYGRKELDTTEVTYFQTLPAEKPASFIPLIYSCRLPCLHGNPPPVGTISTPLRKPL